MSSPVERLQSWMAEPEAERLEFKEAKNNYDYDKLARYCCALANEGGGRIVLGVTDKRPRRVVGSRAFMEPGRTTARLTGSLSLESSSKKSITPMAGCLSSRHRRAMWVCRYSAMEFTGRELATS